MRFCLFSLFLALAGCSQLSNRIEAPKVACSTDSLQGDDWPVKVFDSQDQAVNPDELDIRYAGKNWSSFENIQRTPACLIFKRSLQDKLVIRRLGSTSGLIVDFSQQDRSAGVLNLQMNEHAYDSVRIQCPTVTITRERSLPLPVSWGSNIPAQLLVEISPAQGGPIRFASGDQSLMDLTKADEGTLVSFDIQVRPIFMDPSPQAPTRCSYVVDQKAPEPILEVRDPQLADRPESFVAVGSQITFRSAIESTGEDRYEACLLPASSDAVDCSAAKIAEGLIVIQTAGDFRLVYRGVDAAGNSSPWQSAFLQVIDQAKLNKIRELLELTSARINTATPQKALNSYLEALNLYFSLQTQREKQMVHAELEDSLIPLHRLPKETVLRDVESTSGLSYAGIVPVEEGELFAFISQREGGPVLLLKDADNKDLKEFKLDGEVQAIAQPCESNAALVFAQGSDLKIFAHGTLSTGFTDKRLKKAEAIYLSADCQLATVRLPQAKNLIIDLSRRASFVVDGSCFRFMSRPMAPDIEYLGLCVGPRSSKVRYYDAQGQEKSEPDFMSALPKPIQQVVVDGSGIMGVLDDSSTLTMFAESRVIHKQNSVELIGVGRRQSLLYSISHGGKGHFFRVSPGPLYSVSTTIDFVATGGFFHILGQGLGAAVSKDRSRLIWMRPYEHGEALIPSWPLAGRDLMEVTSTHALVSEEPGVFRLVAPYEKLFTQSILYGAAEGLDRKSLPSLYWRPHASYVLDATYERFDYRGQIPFRQGNGGTEVFPFSSKHARSCTLTGGESCIALVFEDRVDIHEFDEQHERRASIALPHLREDLDLLRYDGVTLQDLDRVFYDEKAGILQLSMERWGLLSYDLDALEKKPVPVWVDSEQLTDLGSPDIKNVLSIGRNDRFLLVGDSELIVVDQFMQRIDSVTAQQIGAYFFEGVQYDEARESLLVTTSTRHVVRIRLSDMNVSVLVEPILSEGDNLLTFEEPAIMNSDGVRAFCYQSGHEVVRVDLNLEHARAALQAMLPATHP